MAIFGWTSPKQAALYTKAADQKPLAADAMDMVDPDYIANEGVPPDTAVASGGTIRGKKS